MTAENRRRDGNTAPRCGRCRITRGAFGLSPETYFAIAARSRELGLPFDRTDELGTVAAGKFADLLLLEGNPLEDIRNTQRIRAVVADGRLYRRADLDRLLADVEASNQQENRRQ